MASNTKRIPVKHIRDRAKARYPAKICCEICSTTEELELHHYRGMQNLLTKWQKENGLALDTDEEVIAVRDRFIAEHEHEIFVEVVCLCSKHHKALHFIYTKSPSLASAPKQMRWVQLQKDKHNGMVSETNSETKPSSSDNQSSGGWFSRNLNNSNSFGSFQQAGVRESWNGTDSWRNQ